MNHRTRTVLAITAIVAVLLTSCTSSSSESTPTPPGAVVPRATINPQQYPLPALEAQATLVQNVLQQPLPVLLLIGLDAPRAQAQEIAVTDSRFQGDLWDASTGAALRNEIFGVYPMRESDITDATAQCQQSTCYRVEMYNYAKNLTTVGFVSVTDKTLLAVTKMADTQPDAPQYLVDLAVQIASESPEVIAALGYKPNGDDARMTNTKTALNLTRCQRSRHLCLAPTFVDGDRALWAIVDLTDGVLVGVRWTDVGTYGPAVTQRSLQDDIVTQLYCDKATALERGDWRMNFILTSSDGLRISDVQYKSRAILESAKLVDWHVSYSTTEAFGYSDAVGCPIFSQAAVVAFQGPTVEEIVEDGEIVGFRLQQEFWGEQWPLPCSYFYVQRFDFYNDGRFRVAAGNIGRGCGTNGTYRPVLRLALAAENSFATWTDSAWQAWSTEGWQAQSDSEPTDEGYQYRFADSSGAGFYVEPGRGQFAGERGDNAFIFITLDHPDRDEGDSDMITIGPCCNVNYEQGPERFIDNEPIENAELILWYVPQVENDGAPGEQYCWAESVLDRGVYTAKEYPCYMGPMFVPIQNP
ncbi:MAG TPA: hypothetical protein PKK96_14460 [Anaerolineales bacterium]|nr:hypothetical protein [Anaerolineales bacterium]HNQ93600.1 hypothetical protein [Anaerolineales bacterium]HNS62203.1 hypothetical protein [Anaerolineales bacterium]